MIVKTTVEVFERVSTTSNENEIHTKAAAYEVRNAVVEGLTELYKALGEKKDAEDQAEAVSASRGKK